MTTTEEMKPWQHGIELDELKRLEGIWSDYNSNIKSPFLEMKKNKIAEAIHNNHYDDTEDYAVQSRVLKVGSRINMYSAYTVPIASPNKGDRIVDRVAYKDKDKAIDVLRSFNEDTFLYINEECESDREVATKAGYTKIGVKINTFSDILGVYFKGQPTIDGTMREFPEKESLLSVEFATQEKANIPDLTGLCESIRSKLDDMAIQFTNHYSNYNSGKKAWSAISLRGYLPDYEFITKPQEMNKKWKKENEGIDFELQDTSLRKDFPEVEEILSYLPGEPHRIRFMNLVPNDGKVDGELGRHTDQVDPDAGVTDGKLMRFHIPIRTNEKVLFTLWDCEGNMRTENMKVGECWYMDMRKPHRVINGGDEIRTHLVIDVVANDEVRKLMENDR
tara:strand:+ start:5578 stop:6750 length:1173 start_codon:yes stop_codon:yes gene_type:complete